MLGQRSAAADLDIGVDLDPRWLAPSSVLKISDNGHHPSVGVRVCLELELLENLCCVRLNSPFCDYEATGDSGVRQTFGDQSQYLTLSLGELVPSGSCFL